MKFEKLASTHVWNRRMCLKYRMMFPCVCADRYGPKQACKHICLVLKSSGNFFTPPKGESDSRSKYLSGELKIISVLTWPEGVWTSITLTFGWREKVSRAF